MSRGATLPVGQPIREIGKAYGSGHKETTPGRATSRVRSKRDTRISRVRSNPVSGAHPCLVQSECAKWTFYVVRQAEPQAELGASELRSIQAKADRAEHSEIKHLCFADDAPNVPEVRLAHFCLCHIDLLGMPG